MNWKERKLHTSRTAARRKLLSAPRRRREKLKAERVQEKLKAMPGWALQADGKGIDCIREFAHPAGVAEFASFVAVLAAAERQPVAIAIFGSQVSVVVPARQGAFGFTSRELEFARQLG